ncbi:MAG: tetratricopeptide repeat protein [Bacteroidales bacterium]|nr:tetratricopeptide repeat protein [Bacteroidales bacterium]
MKSKNIIITLLVIMLVVVFSSCSTKKNTFTRRSYHNLTTHYNGYWNANDNLKTTVKQMRDNGVDNFMSVIPVVYYGNKQEAQSMKPNLDNSIEKSFLMIRRHSMVFNSEEKIKWIDDCYMVIGKSYFFQKDFSNARRTFQYIIKTYPNKTTQHEAQLWLAKTYIQNREFEKAQVILEDMQPLINNFEVVRSIQKEFPIVYADYYLSQKKYDDAVKYLEKSLEQNKGNKKLKQRVNFILGQINQQQESYSDASKYFKKSTKGNDFMITFNSKIRMAQCADPKEGAYVVKILNKMLKEDKNKDFRDQIYYALAEVARRNGDQQSEMKYLALSVATSVNNNYQKALGAYKLADIYFEQKKYIESQPYYDTTVQFLPTDYVDYVQIKEKTNILTDLVSNLMIVQTEDSLQNLATMDESKRMAIIGGIIADLKEQERIQREIEMQQQRDFSASTVSQYEDQRLTGRLGSTNNWYFYNNQMVSSGISEFKRRWGNRKQEDLWFLKNKQSFSWDELDDIVIDDSVTDTTEYITDVMDERYYLQYLPLTEEKMALSNEKIEKALYDAGFISSERLGDLELSNECFNNLIRRFPESKYLLLSYYMKYMNCQEMTDIACVNETKSNIISKFPDSDYAKLLQDPTYAITMRERLDASRNLYTDVYLTYEDKMFDVVQLYAQEGIELNDSDFVPKFLYMSAMADLAKNEDSESAFIKFKEITEKYSNSEVSPLAQNMIDYFGKGEEVVMDSATMATIEKEKQEQEKFEQEVSQYKYKCNTTYFYVLVLDNTKSNIKATTTRVSDYLMRYHKLDNLKSNSVMLTDKYELVTVVSFTDCNKALDFYENAIVNQYIYAGLPSDAYYHFVISQENYPVFYRSKNLDAYIYFFNTKLLSMRD